MHRRETDLHEHFNSAFNHVQQRRTHVRTLIHRRARIHQKHNNCHRFWTRKATGSTRTSRWVRIGEFRVVRGPGLGDECP